MASIQEMFGRIAREINRPEITGQIPEAVLSAIANYERKRFFFNETTTSVATVALQESYALPSNFLRHVDHIQFTSNNTQWRLEPMPYQFFAERDHVNPTFGQSSYWTIYQNKLFLWPIPDTSTYSIKFNYIKQLPALTDNQSNSWTVECERLIRARAKYYLAMDTLHDMALAQEMRAIEKEALFDLRQETDQRAMSGRLLARYL